MNPSICAELESELEARQRQTPAATGGESLRGVHEQVIRLVDNMVQNYLGNVRRTIQRMTNFIDSRRPANGQPRQQPSKALAPSNDYHQADPNLAINGQFVDGFAVMRQSILDRIQLLSKRMHDFTMNWTRAVGRQQSPLIDRIPPRGVELWRDFWDTVRKQVRRINQEFWQLSQDMSRMLTGRYPSAGTQVNIVVSPSLHYALDGVQHSSEISVAQRFQEFYDKMSVTLGEEQLRLDAMSKQHQHQQPAPLSTSQQNNQNNNLIDEQDDEMTKQELNRNVALRQQIQQEISIFGSIFDIMRAFITRLRESASNVVRDVMQPGASSNNNNNDPVTPGPSVKPQVDKLLGETIESQRQINGQAQPVLVPNKRPALNKEQ